MAIHFLHKISACCIFQAILRGSEIYYFEAKASSSDSIGSLSSNSLSSPDAFVRLDYTVDLTLDDEGTIFYQLFINLLSLMLKNGNISADSSMSNTQPDLIVCRFKPVIDKRIENGSSNSNSWRRENEVMPSSLASGHRTENEPFHQLSGRYNIHGLFIELYLFSYKTVLYCFINFEKNNL